MLTKSNINHIYLRKMGNPSIKLVMNVSSIYWHLSYAMLSSKIVETTSCMLHNVITMLKQCYKLLCSSKIQIPNVKF